MTRRQVIALFSAGLPLRAQNAAKIRLPLVCVSSSALTGVGYAEIGEIVKQIGFDGVNITVMPGGLVEPHQAPVDEVRALESIHGAGLETPIITTGLTTPYDPWSRTVLALAGRTGVGLFTCAPAMLSQRELVALGAVGREYKIALTIPTACDDTGMDPRTGNRLLAGTPPEWGGLSLDSRCFQTPSAAIADRIEEWMPRVKAVSLSDLSGDAARPLGKGAVGFDRLFAVLARAGFNGPITVMRRYKTSDEPGALSRDVEFVRKQIQAAYGTPKS